jgi:hypothetical protein
MRHAVKSRDGTRLSKRRAADLAQLLGAIYQAEGNVTPRAVWQRCRSKTSPLHSQFEWNNGLAADLYRDYQASALIRTVMVSRDGCPDVRAYAHVSVDGSCYMPISKVATVREMFQEILADAIGYLDSARRRLEGIESLRPEFQTVDDASQKLNARARMLARKRPKKKK